MSYDVTYLDACSEKLFFPMYVKLLTQLIEEEAEERGSEKRF